MEIQWGGADGVVHSLSYELALAANLPAPWQCLSITASGAEIVAGVVELPELTVCWINVRAKTAGHLYLTLNHSPLLFLGQFGGAISISLQENTYRQFLDRGSNLCHLNGEEITVEFASDVSSQLFLINPSLHFLRSLDLPIRIPSTSSFLSTYNRTLSVPTIERIYELLQQQAPAGWASFVFEEGVRQLIPDMVFSLQNGHAQPAQMSEADYQWLLEQLPEWNGIASHLSRGHPFAAPSLKSEEPRLRQLIKALYGLSLNGFETEQRMVRARWLLQQPSLTVKAIASQVGYRNVFYFTRVFTRFWGEPPARFRKLQ